MIKKDPNVFVTNGTLDEAVDTILKGMDDLFEKQNKHLDQRFDGVDKRLDKVESEIVWTKDDVKGLTADLSGAPTKKEFNQLKGKVDKYLAS
jgi:archaellum component FlaC